MTKIATRKYCNTLYQTFGGDLTICPTYQILLDTNNFIVNGNYQNNQLVKETDISVNYVNDVIINGTCKLTSYTNSKYNYLLSLNFNFSKKPDDDVIINYTISYVDGIIFKRVEQSYSYLLNPPSLNVKIYTFSTSSQISSIQIHNNSAQTNNSLFDYNISTEDITLFNEIKPQINASINYYSLNNNTSSVNGFQGNVNLIINIIEPTGSTTNIQTNVYTNNENVQLYNITTQFNQTKTIATISFNYISNVTQNGILVNNINLFVDLSDNHNNYLPITLNTNISFY
jgi:hypothetical protein